VLTRTAIVNAAQGVLALHTATRLTEAQAAARKWSLAEFTRRAWHVIEPATPLVSSWPLEAICLHVEAAVSGKFPRQNLGILVPPGFAKSTVTAVMMPAWALATRPWLRFICASGTPSVAIRDSLRCRQIVESHWYRQTFGIQWSLADDQNQKSNFQTSAGGSRLALGTGSSVTGARADVLLVDDGLDAAHAFSKAERERINNWWPMFANRLAHMSTGITIIIQQRLHVDDLIGHATRLEPNAWCLLKIPQLFVASQRCVTPIWRDPRTTDNELALPERFPQSVIDGERLRLGASGFSAQHQQAPFIEGGEIFKRAALQLWEAGRDLPECTRITIAADTAFKTTDSSDYSALVVIGAFEQGYFLLDIVRARLAYPQLRGTLTELAARWRPSAVIIEDAASGQSLLQDLRQSTVLPIVAVKPLGDKLMRAHTAVPTWEAHRCFAMASAPWLDDFLDELTAFPRAPHDDMVDSFVMALRHLTDRTGPAGLLEFYAKELGTTPQQAKEPLSRLGAIASQLVVPWRQ
jgi:predicted phage terminase large subunit-like protein